MLSTLLYGNDAWTLCTHQERRLNILHLLNVGITSQIQAFWNLQASQACFHYSMKVTYVGSAMSDGWMLNEFQKTFCLVNLQLAPDALQGPSSGASIQLPEKHWPQIEASGEQLSRLPQA